jgi:hypothetical protein
MENILAKKCIELFKENINDPLPEEYDYKNLALCVIDSVFSISVRYEGVKNTINNFCLFLNVDRYSNENQPTVSEILSKLSNYSLEEVTTKNFKNRQRTS